MSYRVDLPIAGVAGAWRDLARRALSHKIPPEAIQWGGATDLFTTRPLPDQDGPHRVSVPAAFLDLARTVVFHSAADRFHWLYTALWRLAAGEGAVLVQSDPLGRRLHQMAKSVRRDIHKTHAFVRFRELPATGPRRRFAAWFEPEHPSLEPAAPFFARRFADMDWMIATPHLSAHFDANGLRFGPPQPRPDLPEDANEALWATYFANIFNPARVKLQAMRSEMPKKYWKNLPETRLIPDMLAEAEGRVARMQAAMTAPRPGAAAVSTRYRAAMPVAPAAPQTLAQAAAAAAQCRRCSLCEAATQTVFGRPAQTGGSIDLMIVGEAPGDQEDLAGRAFIGPSGQLLMAALAKAGLDPRRIWLSNAVKHFKFDPHGRTRRPVTPLRAEVAACRGWLELEYRLIRPRLTVALGAVAAFALTGAGRPLTARRGMQEAGLFGPVLLSWHPAHILRTGGAAAERELVNDLRRAGEVLACPTATPTSGGGGP